LQTAHTHEKQACRADDTQLEHRMTGLRGLAILLVLQALGEALTHALGLPIPGPVLGLVLLLAALQLAWVRTPVAAAAELLLAHLSLLFIPVGVGVITHLGLVAQYGLRLAAIIVLSTWIGMAVTALVLRALLPRTTGVSDPQAEADHG
jgi:holin-like protein